MFDLNKNIGWQKLKVLKLTSQVYQNQTEKKERIEGFKNICLYEFSNLYILSLCKITISSEYFNLSKSAIKYITKAKWDNLQTL